MPKLPKCVCKQCKATWTPRTDKPKACPSCKSRKWDEA